MPFSYENYDDISSTYGDMRRPVGHKQQLEFFRQNAAAPDLRDQHLLDAGCGTGNYMAEYVHHFKSLRCVDYSAGMLRAAKAKLHAAAAVGADAARVSFEQGDVSNLVAVASASVDAACCNQVLHHLRADDAHTDLRRTARELFRVLRRDGRVVVNYTAPESQLYATWWSELIPDAVSRADAVVISRAGSNNSLHLHGRLHLSPGCWCLMNRLRGFSRILFRKSVMLFSA